jgi:ammonium transporter, Amt family
VFAKVAIANSEGAFAGALEADPTFGLGLLEGNAGQIVTQIIAVAATIAYCAIVTFVILKLVDLIVGLRVDRDSETTGLDLALHGEAVH